MDCAGTGMAGDQQLMAVTMIISLFALVALLVFIYAMLTRNNKE